MLRARQRRARHARLTGVSMAWRPVAQLASSLAIALNSALFGSLAHPGAHRHAIGNSFCVENRIEADGGHEKATRPMRTQLARKWRGRHVGAILVLARAGAVYIDS